MSTQLLCVCSVKPDSGRASELRTNVMYVNRMWCQVNCSDKNIDMKLSYINCCIDEHRSASAATGM